MYLPNRAFESIEGENEIKYTLQRNGQITYQPEDGRLTGH